MQHFVGELERYYGVLDPQLAERECLVGERYPIADIANFAVADVGATAGVDRCIFQNQNRWWSKISSRPAVQRGSSNSFPQSTSGQCLLEATY